MKAIRVAAVVVSALALSLAGAVAGAAAQEPTLIRIVLIDGQYLLGSRAFDELSALERAVRSRSPRAVQLDACGSAAADGLKAAAHRLAHLTLHLRMLDRADAACAVRPLATDTTLRSGPRPSTRDDAAVDAYWRRVMP